MSADGARIFGEIDEAFADYEPAAGSRSRAPLLWLLTNPFQVDLALAQDAICDAPNDKGIDAIFVDETERVIMVLQSKRRGSPEATAGDNDIKKLVGSIQQLATVDGVLELYDSGNDDLKMLIDRLEIRRLVEEGYSTRGVFVTNADRDGNTDSYLRSIEGTVDLELYDRGEIYRILSHMKAPDFVDGPASIRLRKQDSLEYSVSDDVRMLVGLVRAKDLVALPGVDDLSLFAHNVRLDLGNTQINRGIGETVRDTAEHLRFPTYHNGLTIVCKSLTRQRGKVVLQQFSVVNGCQSVRTLARNRAHLTDNLRVLARIVEVRPDAGQRAALEMIERITLRSNNQNGVSMRDLRSGDDKQRSLASELEQLTDGRVAYAIHRGKHYDADVVINNDYGAQLLVSVYDGKPWTAHQKSKLFDTDYDAVFPWRIHGQHVYLAYLLHQAIMANVDDIKNRSVAGYQLATFVMVHALAEILRSEPDGQTLLDDPTPYVDSEDEIAVLQPIFDKLARKIMVDMNYFLKQEMQNDDLFDYKRAFKQEAAVKRFVAEAIRGYDKSVIDDASNSFRL